MPFVSNFFFLQNIKKLNPAYTMLSNQQSTISVKGKTFIALMI